MRLSKLGIAWGVSLALIGCASLPAWGLGRKRTCGGEPPAVTRCSPLFLDLAHRELLGLACLDSDGETRFALTPGVDAAQDARINELVCKPAAHEERMLNWCLGHP